MHAANGVRDMQCRGRIIVDPYREYKSIVMMNNIDLDDLRTLDLNLLPTFLMLLEERSTTKAAAKLGIGQPAVSAALARLREIFKDPLFVRIPRGMEPTDRALELGSLIAPAIGSIQQSLRPREVFTPEKASLTLRLGLPDNHEHFIIPELLHRLQSKAPDVRLITRQTSGYTAPSMLDAREIDLACGRIDKISAWQRREPLRTVNYLCLYDNEQLRLSGSLSLAKFTASPHLLTSARGDFEGIVDKALAKLGKTRRVIFATQHFSALPVVLKRIPAIATLPEQSAKQFAVDYKLVATAPPLFIPSYETALVWLGRFDEDPVHQWFRAIVRQTVVDLTKPLQRAKKNKCAYF